MKVLEFNTIENSELVEQTFYFWFRDNGHIRSPFPFYIQDNLRKQAIERFHNWANNLLPEAKEELNDEAVGEKFEEIIFDTALNLVLTEDEKITILYPFMPRTGDKLSNDKGEESTITDRLIEKVDGVSYLKLVCTSDVSNEKWTTKFELPV